MIAVSRNNESIPTMEEKRAAVDEIVSSQTLGRSDQLKAFLHFVCESEINGSGDELNEYLIGVQVLGRPEGYSTSDDATVRTYLSFGTGASTFNFTNISSSSNTRTSPG